jgi:hypothetical protein
MEATTIRAVVGRFDSIKNMKGANVHESVRDERENILRRRKVKANGPLYKNSGCNVDVVCLGTVEDEVDSERCWTRNELGARFS